MCLQNAKACEPYHIDTAHRRIHRQIFSVLLSWIHPAPLLSLPQSHFFYLLSDKNEGIIQIGGIKNNGLHIAEIDVIVYYSNSLIAFSRQSIQYIASSSQYRPQSRHLFECFTQQFVFPEGAIYSLHPGCVHFVVGVP